MQQIDPTWQATQAAPAPIGRQLVGSERLYRALSYGFELLKGLVVLVVLALLVHLFVATVFRISGESMVPNFEDGQFVLVDRLSYLIGPYQRGDVVVIEFPGDPEKRKFIKRIIGLPGDTVKISQGKVYVNGALLPEPYLPDYLYTEPELEKVVRADELFVVGDNRPNSNDSRFFGPVPHDNVIGKSQARLTGAAYGWIAQPAY
ncbi:MAG: signal peptidase I [Patescibacteria group bacterium]|jgi:signal peptidase I